MAIPMKTKTKLIKKTMMNLTWMQYDIDQVSFNFLLVKKSTKDYQTNELGPRGGIFCARNR